MCQISAVLPRSISFTVHIYSIRLKCRLQWMHWLKSDFILVSALQDLWDFSPDEEDYESSHDRSHDSNDDEENMDTGWCFCSIGDAWATEPKNGNQHEIYSFWPKFHQDFRTMFFFKNNFLLTLRKWIKILIH